MQRIPVACNLGEFGGSYFEARVKIYSPSNNKVYMINPFKKVMTLLDEEPNISRRLFPDTRVSFRESDKIMRRYDTKGDLNELIKQLKSVCKNVSLKEFMEKYCFSSS